MDLSQERFFVNGRAVDFSEETPPLLIEKTVKIPYEVERW